MFRRLFWLLLSVLFLVGAGCSGGTGAEKDINGKAKSPGSAVSSGMQVKIATMKGPSALSMIKMIEDKSLLSENAHTEYLVKDSPEPVKAMLIQNEADIATIPTNLASILYNKGVRYQAAGISIWGTLYLVGRDKGITDWEGLKNKRIYLMAKGMTPDISFRYMLEKKGIDPEHDVILDYRYPMPQDLAGAVGAGQADPAVLSEPMVSTLLARNGNLKILMDLNREWENLSGNKIPQTCVFVKKDFAAEYPEVVAEFLTEYRESVRWVNTNPEQAGKLAVKHGLFPQAGIAAKVISRCNMNYEDAYAVKEEIRDYLSQFYHFDPNIVGGRLPDEDFFYKR